ncbi:MAG: [protein-PII] uridylyltransferase [Thiohalocapsa sp.]|jgi:[protein-PII] uridylyltransferase|uniref:[protein-PII] uridylyltransferase n=1 Tax=Thiohalocapsa sp. TaxID=2497641 RepID=UPI0025D4A5C5|nr:[protein-PII] uridylyltransferase [Thiohalocapsa sp.]MCG6943312.1 [protein-PII] uridylyltransferase [Thiohalocapsa sp.]
MVQEHTIPPATTAAPPGTADIAAFKAQLSAAREALFARFDRGEPVTELVRRWSNDIDAIISATWRRFMPDGSEAAVVAVGGYGREELHPNSDIDLLILVGEGQAAYLGEAIGALVIFLWDLGLEIGHSVRTVDECRHEAADDITIVTNLLEARLIDGDAPLFECMRAAVGPDSIWPSEAFFAAKREEQRKRRQKYGDTAYNLEPNIKENPGGLRDIQMIAWVTKRHFGADSLHQLVEQGFLTETEYLALCEGQALLWRIRFALHRLTRRREDRLLFDYQRTLANEFGFTDQGDNLAVEQFMQQYYRAVMELNRLNEMLMQLFQEAILLHDQIGPPEPVNKRFQVRSGYLEVTHPQVFARSPFALLEIFLVLQQRPELLGVRARTIRLIREYRHRIDDDFREDVRARSLFMEILRQPRGVTAALRRMNSYGVLAAYVPAFANIVGRMQYDLFHVYTVDEHTLRLLRNLRRFTIPEHNGEFPLCSAIAQRVPKQELLYLAGLFHDIAKGRSGDHSLLGAREAWDFCQLHYLSEYDSRLVAWLVEHHLLMSMTAQRKDIADPVVIQAFAEQVSDLNRLDYLYLLTVADSRATNPKRWNSWKDALLRDLYHAARRALMRGLDNPQAQDDLIEQKQREAMRLLALEGIDADDCRDLWSRFGMDFFTPSSPEEIAWQTQRILVTAPDQLPLVVIRPLASRGCTEVFLFSRDEKNLFVRITALLDQRALNIMDARITTTDDGFAVNAFQVLGPDHCPIDQGDDTEALRESLLAALRRGDGQQPVVNRRLPRQHRHFPVETRVSFSEDTRNQRTMMRLSTLDRPGLLAEIGSVFEACDIRLQSAKIATVGAEVDDVFFISTQDGAPITCETALTCLRKAIHERLESSAEKRS